MFATRQATNRVDICNYDSLIYRDYDRNINFSKHGILSQTPPPMTYRDLRSVVSHIASSNVVILPESFNPSKNITPKSPILYRRRHSSRRKPKSHSFNIVSSHSRTDACCSLVPEREITQEDMMILANSFIVDHVSPSPTSGFFHPQYLPNIQKQRTNNNNNNNNNNNQTKINYSSTPSLRIQHVGHSRPTPIDTQYEDHKTHGTGTNQTKSNGLSSSSLHIQHLSPPSSLSPQRITPTDRQYEVNSSQRARTSITTMGTMPITTISSTTILSKATIPSTTTSLPLTAALSITTVPSSTTIPSAAIPPITVSPAIDSPSPSSATTMAAPVTPSPTPDIKIRKELHVYMPQIFSY